LRLDVVGSQILLFMIRPLPVLCMALISVLVAGCGSNKKEAVASPSETDPAAQANQSESTPVDANPTTQISSARESLKEGNVAEAAARLAALQAQGAGFDARQAKDYRQALSEAYDKALEGAQRGDPKAQEALALLRAAGPR
jgi:hypothetical protein